MKKDLSNLEQALSGTPLIDIGSTSLTGIRIDALPDPGHLRFRLGNPVHSTVALCREDSLRLGSDLARTGFLFDPPQIEQGIGSDPFGVSRLQKDGKLSPCGHPLESAGLAEISRYPKPRWRREVQLAETGAGGPAFSIADAPCPGVLELCFLLRGQWQFLQDLVGNRPIAEALIEWSAEAVLQAYSAMLGAMSVPPDIIVYADDLGFTENMFFSPAEFRDYLLPAQRTLLTRLGQLTPAAVCFHTCGAVAPILEDIADMGVELLNLDTTAANIDIDKVRSALPDTVVLHGCTDLCELGAAVGRRDKAVVARLITEMARSAPLIAAPADSISHGSEVLDAVRGAAFIRNIDSDDFHRLGRIGPIRSIIEEAMEGALLAPLPQADSIGERSRRPPAAGPGKEVAAWR